MSMNCKSTDLWEGILHASDGYGYFEQVVNF